MKDKTTLISTHRLDTVLAADVVYVMDEGQIVDFGSHAELIKRCRLYYTLMSKEEQAGELGISV